jgi:hypothetical protein
VLSHDYQAFNYISLFAGSGFMYDRTLLHKNRWGGFGAGGKNDSLEETPGAVFAMSGARQQSHCSNRVRTATVLRIARNETFPDWRRMYQ